MCQHTIIEHTAGSQLQASICRGNVGLVTSQGHTWKMGSFEHQNTSFCFQPISTVCLEAPFMNGWGRQQPYALFETLPVGKNKDFSSLIQKNFKSLK